MSFERHNQSSASRYNGFLPDRRLLSSVGATLLQPVFAAGHFIFGLGEGGRKEMNGEPYRSEIRPSKYRPAVSEQAGELIDMTEARTEGSLQDSDFTSDRVA